MRVLLICIFLSTYSTSCKLGLNKDNKVLNSGLSFDSTVLLIEKKVIDLTSAEDLFAVQEFVSIYEAPQLFGKDVIAFISRSDRTDQQKLIAVYSMQRSSLDEYLKILKKAIVEYKKDRLSEVVLENIISAPIGKQKIILNNVSNQKVLELLNEIREDNKVSENLKDRIERIISDNQT